MLNLRGSPTIPSYADLRAVGRSFVSKVLKASPRSTSDAMRAARTLGLPTPGGTFVFRDETDIVTFTDFELREFRVAGRCRLESCDPTRWELTPQENVALCAWQHSRTSLFQTVGALPESNQVRLLDLLEPERPGVLLTDINLCTSLRSIRIDVLLFLRLLEIQGITMSSGFFFAFHPSRAAHLLQSFRQSMKKVPPEDWSERKFTFFYRKYREFGEAQEYGDVPT
jgi:hypothetical protein